MKAKKKTNQNHATTIGYISNLNWVKNGWNSMAFNELYSTHNSFQCTLYAVRCTFLIIIRAPQVKIYQLRHITGQSARSANYFRLTKKKKLFGIFFIHSFLYDVLTSALLIIYLFRNIPSKCHMKN